MCSLADDDIIGLVGQREQARRSKDFGTADALRTQLRAAGVELFDREKYWRVNDGRRGGYEDAASRSLGGVGGAGHWQGGL